MQERHYRADVDGLRAVAILAVLAFHAFPKGFRGGFLGVDVFFVLSGFLIGGIVLRERAAGVFSLADFYRRRARRILPALFVVLLSCLVLGSFVLLDVEFAQLAEHAAFGAFGLANLSLHGDSGYFSMAAEINPLLHLWSLGVEEQFYLVLPLMVLALGGRGRWFPLAAVAVFAVSLWLSVDPFGKADASSKFYLPQYRAWELMAGVLLACSRWSLPGQGAWRTARNVASLVGVLLLLLAFRFLKAQSPGWLTGGVVVAATLLIISAGPGAVANRWLAARWVVWVGLISYPLYLWHWPLLVFGRLLWPELGAVAICAILALSVVLAWLTWRYVEAPIRARRWRLVTPVRLGLSMVCVAVLAGFVLALEGRAGWVEVTDARAFKVTELTRDKQCHDRYWGGSMPSGIYVLCSDASPAARPSVALVGDSHASHLYEGLRAYYARQGKDVVAYTTSGCPLNPEPPGNKRCAAAYAQIFARVAQSGASTVVLGEYVHTMAFDVRPGWTASMRERVKALHAEGRRVVLMLDVPELGKEPRQFCYPRPFASVQDLEARCSVPRARYDWRTTQYRDKAAQAVAGMPGVVVFDLPRVLCNEHRCDGIKDGWPIYRDTNHLNYFGALYVARFFDWELEPVQ